MTLWTFENLTVGGYVVDCPQRERMGYGGDAHATTTTGLSNYKLGAFYTKWSEDWRDVQGKTGDLPYTAPTYFGGGGPAWSGYYQRYGDKRILEQNLPTIERWLTFLETKAKGNLLRRWGGRWDFLGDWLWPGAPPVTVDAGDGTSLSSRLYKHQIVAQRHLRRWAERLEITLSSVPPRSISRGPRATTIRYMVVSKATGGAKQVGLRWKSRYRPTRRRP